MKTNKHKKKNKSLPGIIVLTLILTLSALSVNLLAQARNEYRIIQETMADFNEKMDQHLEEKEREIARLRYEASKERFCSLSYVECFDDSNDE